MSDAADPVESKRQQQAKQQELKRIQAANAERRAKPWVIYINGKFYQRVESHAQCLRISKAISRSQLNVTITQRYEGKQIDHQPGRRGQTDG